jgi:hypothetical protein
MKFWRPQALHRSLYDTRTPVELKGPLLCFICALCSCQSRFYKVATEKGIWNSSAYQESSILFSFCNPSKSTARQLFSGEVLHLQERVTKEHKQSFMIGIFLTLHFFLRLSYSRQDLLTHFIKLEIWRIGGWLRFKQAAKKRYGLAWRGKIKCSAPFLSQPFDGWCSAITKESKSVFVRST